MPPIKWKSEYEGKFIEAQGAVFDFSGCILQGPHHDYNEIYLGLDFGTGSGQDNTVLTGINEHGEQIFIWAVNDLSPTQQVSQIGEIADSLIYHHTDPKGKQLPVSKIKAFYAEQNSIGKIYSDAIIQNGHTLNPFITTNTTKRKLVESLQVAFRNKEIKLMPDPVQTAELSFYESKVNPVTNLVTYNAPAGMHDDHIISLMLAYKGYKENTINNGKKYNIIL